MVVEFHEVLALLDRFRAQPFDAGLKYQVYSRLDTCGREYRWGTSEEFLYTVGREIRCFKAELIGVPEPSGDRI